MLSGDMGGLLRGIKNVGGVAIARFFLARLKGVFPTEIVPIFSNKLNSGMFPTSMFGSWLTLYDN